MADFVLKVTPAQLETRAKAVESHIKAFENDWKQMTDIIRNSKGYWAGDASTTHQKYFKECEDDVLQIIKRLKEHPRDLLTMAGIYKESENKASQLAKTVPGDVIM